MKTKNSTDIFAERLNAIFECGDPTKALILDAYNKAVEKERKKAYNKGVKMARSAYRIVLNK